MIVIKKEDDPEFHRVVTDGNLLRQFDFMKYAVEIALRHPARPLSHEVLKQLNNHVVVFLCDTPGRYREVPVTITNSDHRPPEPRHVNRLMDECVRYLADHWTDRPTTHLAAYALWRLNWVHPFVEGNGRTARATCYYILCVKHGFWLPGTNTIPKQISDDRKPYYDALRAADAAFAKDGSLCLDEMEAYLAKLLGAQLSS